MIRYADSPLQGKRRRLESLRAQLDQERSSWMPYWRDINDYILPNRARFTSQDFNRGDRRNQKIIDSTASTAARTLRSGMMSGMTSPSLPWLELTTADPGLAKFGPVKEWLAYITDDMRGVHTRCGIYKHFPILYGDVSGFGTAAMMVEEDLEGRVIRTHPFAPGTYMVANDDRGKVSVFARELTMTVRQVVMKFGLKNPRTGMPDWSNISAQTRRLWEKGDYEQRIEVAHFIQPNEFYDPRKLDSRFARYSSCYYETGVRSGTQTNYMGNEGEDQFLREKGYRHFPVIVPRWETTDGDAYGTMCPGMMSLGDVKSLQDGEKRIAKAEDKMIDPPMKGPPSLMAQRASILSGDITYVQETGQGQGFSPAHEVRFAVDQSEAKQAQTRTRIKRVWFEDIFLMFQGDERKDRATAAEIIARKQEQLTELSPVLENINDDGLDPLVDITFEMMMRQGRIPPPPADLRGQMLQPRYISTMANAQRAAGLGKLDRFLGVASSILGALPDPAVAARAAQKIDVDRAIEVAGEAVGLEPGVVRDADSTEALRAAQAQAEQAAAAIEQAKMASETARNLGATDTGRQNALTDLLSAAKAGQGA